MRLVQHYLIEAAQRFSEKTAIICDEKKLTYTEFIEKTEAVLAVLSETGLRKGDRALILLSDKADFLVAFYAVIARGAIAVPLGEGIAFPTIEQIAQDCSPFILVTSSRDLGNYPLLCDRLSCRVMFFDKEKMDTSSHSEKLNNVEHDDGAAILFTSGTTGRRKGVLLSHRNLIQATLNINEFMRIDSNIREFVAVPLTHSFGLGRSRCVLFAGGTLVVNNGMLNPVALVRSVLKHQCDAISSVPSGFAMFFGRLESLLQRIGPQVRFIELGSSPMPLDHKMKLLEIFPNARICMHYGLTEASRSTFIEFRTEQRKLHTAGFPSPNVAISIVDEEGRKVRQMQTGEILVRGDHVAVGYWQDDKLNTERYTKDGWLKTGDYGYLDEEGYLHLLGRKDEMINMGGVKISPLEVEEKIHETYPDWQVCVVGIPDPAGIVGEIPVLCYISRDGKKITSSELSQVLSNRLEREKTPRIVYRVNSFPVSGNKIVRKELRRKILNDPEFQPQEDEKTIS